VVVKMFRELSLILLASIILSTSAFAQQRASGDLEVRITGVSDAERENVTNSLSIYAFHEQQAPRAFRLRYLHRNAEKEIKKALQPFGYYHVEVEAELSTSGDDWIASYQIELGTVTRVNGISLEIKGEAQADPAFQRLAANLPLKQNDPFRHDRYERIKTALRNLAAERGYYDASLSTHTAKVELSKKQADLAFVLDSGPRYKYGAVSFSETPLRNSFLQRYLTFDQDDYFSNRALLDLQVALADSDYFAGVEVAPDYRNAADKQIPIDINLTPNNRHRYRFGVGYGTDTGARLTLGHDRRWVNDRGHQFNGIIRLSEVQTTGLVNYVIPGNYPATDHYTLSGEISDRSYEQQRSQLYRLGAMDSRHLSNWQRDIALDWQQEDFSFGDMPSESSQFLIPSTTWTLIKADNRFEDADGFRLSVTLKGGSDALLSDTDFVTLMASGKYVQPLSERWRVLARAEFGATHVDDFETLSPSLRFFAGGDNSVRGYAYQQLGPTDQDGVVVGGKYLAVGSLEFDYQFKPSWRAAIFTDIGNAMMRADTRLKQSVGVGIRWISPIGSVRVDIAQAIDEPDKPWRLSFTIGPDL